jgi:type IV pilus assembly protein PilC
MIEVKFSAQKLDGQFISGVLSNDSYWELRKQIKEIAIKNKYRINKVERKSTFRYKVRGRNKNEKPIVGYQRAFNKDEVSEAFRLLGYEIISIRKNLFEFTVKPTHAEILNFVLITSDMLEESLPFSEILTFLINDTTNKVLKETLKDISKDLKQGVDGEKVFMKHQSVFGKFTAYMLGLGSKSGNMAEIYSSTAKFLERSLEFKKNLRSALITPSVTVLLIIAASIWYVTYIFPETAKLFLRMGAKLPPMTAFTLKLSDFVGDNAILLIVISIAPFIFLYLFYKHPRGRILFDKYLMRLPMLGDLFHKTYIEIFCRVFYTLYSGSAVSILPIKIAAEATGNRYFEEQVKNISLPMMMKRGIGITDALQASGVFNETALSKFRQGEETGNVKKTAMQLAKYFERETTYKLRNAIEWIQIAIAFVILILMVLLTLISAETAVISPKSPYAG